AQTGRTLANHERDAVATQVRDEWPDKRHRPTLGFHRQRQEQELPTEDWQQTGPLESQSAEEAYFDSLQGGADTERVLDSDARSGTRRKYGWNAMCEQRGIPKAPQGFLSNAQVS